MKRFITMCSLFLYAAVMSYGQDLNITGAGARAEGFGGAFIGVADDATAIVWNPAGLTQLERAEASAVTRFIMEKSEYTAQNFPNLNETIDQSHFMFNFGSFALPLSVGATKLVIAAAYQRQLDFYVNQKSGSSEQEGKGGVDTFTPGLAVRFSPVISIGACANIWTGKWDLTVKSTGTPAQTNTLDLKYKGFNMVFGGLIDLEALPKPVPLKFGVSVRTPFEMTSDGTITYAPPLSQGPFQPTIAQLTASQTIQMPLMLGFGTSIRLSENFTVSADYEMRSYGDREITEKVGDSEFKNPISASKENLNQYRVGAEYLVVAKSYVIPIRAGYKNVPTIDANTDQLGNSTGQAIGKAFSFGTGFIADAFAIDVAYTMSDYTAETPGVESTKYTTNMISSSLIIYF